MVQPELSTPDFTEAAVIAFAMIRFAEGAAHPDRGDTPPGMSKLGDEVYVFAPSYKRVPVPEVPRFLAKLPSEAFLLPTMTRGIVSLHLLSDLAPDRAS